MSGGSWAKRYSTFRLEMGPPPLRTRCPPSSPRSGRNSPPAIHRVQSQMAPLADMVLELTHLAMTSAESPKLRASAEAKLTCIPADGSREVESQPYVTRDARVHVPPGAENQTLSTSTGECKLRPGVDHGKTPPTHRAT
jgi:hypothetical protein